METEFIPLQKRLLRVDEAAEILNVSRWTIYRWLEAGKLAGTKIGVGSVRVFGESVSALIQGNRVGLSMSVGPAPRRDQRASYLSDGGLLATGRLARKPDKRVAV
jgi:excisionase family DNA binding protein